MNKIIAIAIDEYYDSKISNLKNCLKDLNRLIGLLSDKYQFDTIELFSGPEQTTLSFLYRELYSEFVNSVESDSILLIFAGHGEFNPVINGSYWLCSDSNKDDVTTWLNVADILKLFNAAPAKHIAVISDSCFSGAIFEINRGGGMFALEGKASRQALTSGGIEKVSDGYDNSPFNSALIAALENNKSDALSFSQLSESTILNFSDTRNQTPAYGSLIESGDKGGTFFFKLKDDATDIVKSVQIPLEINPKVKIDSSFEIPFFNENKYFNKDYINIFVQQLGYSIINDVRVFISSDEEYSILSSSEIEFYFEVGYTIHTINENFLSLTIGRSEYFGGAHPNHYTYNINFAFKPERKISLYDILDYSEYGSLENFIEKMIDKYAEKDCTDSLKQYLYDYIHEAEFCFNDEFFMIDFTKSMPHVIRACGLLEIPIKKVTFRI